MISTMRDGLVQQMNCFLSELPANLMMHENTYSLESCVPL